jgi:hypothetical protein
VVKGHFLASFFIKHHIHPFSQLLIASSHSQKQKKRSTQPPFLQPDLNSPGISISIARAFWEGASFPTYHMFLCSSNNWIYDRERRAAPVPCIHILCMNVCCNQGKHHCIIATTTPIKIFTSFMHLSWNHKHKASQLEEEGRTVLIHSYSWSGPRPDTRLISLCTSFAA